MKIVVGTSNKGKMDEISRILSIFPDVKVESVDPDKIKGQCEELGNTTHRNASKKAEFYWRQIHEEMEFDSALLVEDTCLEFPFLNNVAGALLSKELFENPDAGAMYIQNAIEAQREIDGPYFPDLHDRLTVECSVVLICRAGAICQTTRVDGRFSPNKGKDGWGFEPWVSLQGVDLPMSELSTGFKDIYGYRGESVRGAVMRFQTAVHGSVTP